MRSITKYTGKFLVPALMLCLSMTCANANTLSEVEVNQNGSGYGIVLKTDSVAQVKKTVSSSDRIAVILKDVSVSDNINTVYNNVDRVENITIQPAGKNDIKIIFKGKGISNSNVSFASANSIAAYPETKSIKLNNPISSYTPVYDPERFAAEEIASQTSNPQLNEVLTKMHISREMLITVKRYTKTVVRKTKNLLGDNNNMLTVFGILLIVGTLLFRPRRKSGAKPQMLKNSIGLQARNSLANPNLDREIERNKELVNNMDLKSSVRSNYGVKAYQQSQRNPYTTANNFSGGVSGIARRKQFPSQQPVGKPIQPKSVIKNSPLAHAVNKKVEQPSAKQMPKQNSKTNTMTATKPDMKPVMKSTVPAGQTEIDSMKFLESITKIYENSGRTDLAKGLKDNLRKAQMSKAV